MRDREVSIMGYFGIVLFLAVVIVALANDDYEDCPPASSISPCTCDGEGMSCMNTATADQIRKAFNQKFPNQGVLNVYVYGTKLDKVTPGLLGTIKTQTIYMEINQIKEVDVKTFNSTSTYVRQISFYGNKLTALPTNFFETFPNLATANFGKNEITSIPSYGVNHNNLNVLILAKNSISNIGSYAFNGLPNLVKLELAFNQLATLTPYSLTLSSRQPGLQINLSLNKISSVSNTALAGTTPQIIFLGGNKLTSLKQEAFGTLLSRMSQQGGLLEVSGNPLTCLGCDYSWIVDNKFVLAQMIAGFVCPDGTGINALTRFKIGC